MKKLTAALLALLLLSGCGTPAVEESVSPVFTDWSKLTPYEPVQPVYTLHPGYCGAGPLEARDDYGALLPYIGKYSTMEQYIIDALPLFGLVTDEGALVSDPVYADIYFYDGFLLLYRGDPDGITGGDAFNGGTYSRTLAAADGRWAHELTDSFYVASGCGLLATSTADGSLDLWNTDGEVVTHFDGAPFTALFGEGFVWGREGGPFLDWTDGKVGYAWSYYTLVNGEFQEEENRLYLDFSSGAVMETPPEGYGVEIDYSGINEDTPEPPVVEGCNYLSPVTDPVTGETYFSGYLRRGENEEGSDALFDGEGRLLVEDCSMWPFEALAIIRAGLCSTLEDDCFCFRSLADNALVFRYPLRTNSD